MNKQKYEEKKYECWLDTANFCGFSTRDDIKHSAFDAAFDRAYELGKQFVKSEQLNAEKTVISGWAARDEDGHLFMYCTKPERNEVLRVWMGRYTGFDLRDSLFPDLTWESDPEQVEIIIKRKKNG